MERLVNLLPELIAANQMLIDALAGRDAGNEEQVTYLDGRVNGAESTSRP